MCDQQLFPITPAFERKVHCGLMTPTAFVSAILESGSVGSFPGLADSYGVHDWANEYAEPGYSNPERGILFGNWNDKRTSAPWPDGLPTVGTRADKRPSRFARIAEYAGYAIEWSDEWSICHGCGRAVRTSPDSYHYTPSFAIVQECELLCVDCLLQDASAYLDELTDNPHACVPADIARRIDFESFGFVKVNTDAYESGWHPGQDDSPTTIASTLADKGYTRILFVQTEQSQFYIKFDVYADAGVVETEEDSAS